MYTLRQCHSQVPLNNCPFVAHNIKKKIKTKGQTRKRIYLWTSTKGKMGYFWIRKVSSPIHLILNLVFVTELPPCNTRSSFRNFLVCCLLCFKTETGHLKYTCIERQTSPWAMVNNVSLYVTYSSNRKHSQTTLTEAISGLCNVSWPSVDWISPLTEK